MLLQNELNKNATDTLHPFQCISGGISGSELFSEYLILKELLLHYKPQRVIVAINQTDIDDVVKGGGWERFTNVKQPPWWAYVYQFSFIARAIIQVVHPVNWLLLTDTEMKAEETKALEKIEQCIMHEYAALAAQQHFKLTVVLHPVLKELEQNTFSLTPLYKKLQQQPSIQTINLFEEFKIQKQQQGFEYKTLYWPIDGHNNSTGYKLWASIAANKI